MDKIIIPKFARLSETINISSTMSVKKLLSILSDVPNKYMLQYIETFPEALIGDDDMFSLFHAIFRQKYEIKSYSLNGILYAKIPECGVYYICKKHHIVIASVSLSFSKEKDTSKLTGIPSKEIKYIIISKSPEKILEKYINIRNDINKRHLNKYIHFNHKIQIDVSNEGELPETETHNFKDFDELVLDKKGDAMKILEIIERFSLGEEVYRYNHINYRLGIILYGKPGVGKTSLILAVSSRYKIPILKLTRDDIFNAVSDRSYYFTKLFIQRYPHDETYRKANEYVGYRGIKAIYLIEEIDSLFTETVQNEDSDDYIQRSDLLAFIDNLPENIIIFGTTNNYDKLDPAFIRSGRFDMKIKMGLFDKEDAKELISKYPSIDESFMNQYSDCDFPMSPVDLERDIVGEICRKEIYKNKED